MADRGVKIGRRSGVNFGSRLTPYKPYIKPYGRDCTTRARRWGLIRAECRRNRPPGVWGKRWLRRLRRAMTPSAARTTVPYAVAQVGTVWRPSHGTRGFAAQGILVGPKLGG